MNRGQVIIIILLISVLGIFSIYNFIFKTENYSVKIEPKILSPDNKSICVIHLKPQNFFGLFIPFKSVNSQFRIVEGKDLVDVVSFESEISKLILRAKEKPGKVRIQFIVRDVPLPIECELLIIENVTQFQ